MPQRPEVGPDQPKGLRVNLHLKGFRANNSSRVETRDIDQRSRGTDTQVALEGLVTRQERVKAVTEREKKVKRGGEGKDPSVCKLSRPERRLP